MKQRTTILRRWAGLILTVLSPVSLALAPITTAQLGPRPFFLVDAMTDSPLKERLTQCQNQSFPPSLLSIGHRGAPLQFPEHTRESYIAAARMGAGILECDVTFTQDKELICRHSQNDLHTTTDILTRPELAAKCSTPPDYSSSTPFKQVECRTSDITLTEFLSLKGKMDSGNPQASTLKEYMSATASFRTDLYASEGTLMSHKQSIELFRQLGVKMTPELKQPVEKMPFKSSFSQQDYARKLINEYKEAGIPAADVYPQSFSLQDIAYWIKHTPEFAEQAVYLDGRYRDKSFIPTDPDTFTPSMAELKSRGINIIAPPLWMLVTTSEAIDSNRIIPSPYATEAQKAGLGIITWTLERSGNLTEGGGWYYRSISDAISNDGDVYKILDVLVQDIGIRGIFSDWPATVTYYAGCMNTTSSFIEYNTPAN
ncbi:glycerophosphodiester phosphodiesterase family protein [Oceanospirillum sediminis]|uniref:glycerophosphodiester phosphodiesterase n=1 Tax=Oceanospirillum sediminis TaxID=2760088 RepID=A0A839IN51_9GAMM|nr:glycerophosphodiester phosphodiesterase family protein [Oceanospirillum sediminis]MBB1486130.1 glycerophosphodiester phosphodiesterase [Oceanospirillum sediminis]